MQVTPRLFIGTTRFSIFEPGSGAWHASNGSSLKSDDEYKAYLFNDDRLSMRTRIFLEQSLPQIEAAKHGHHVIHVVSYSSDLPEKYQKALEDATERFPFLVLDRRYPRGSSMPITRVIQTAVSEHHPDDNVFAMYRLDDDDCLAVSFFDRAAPYVISEHKGWNVSLGLGLTGIPNSTGYSCVRRLYDAMTGAGLISICQLRKDGSLETPVGGPHPIVDRTSPVILDSRAVSFFVSRHAGQDSRIMSSGDLSQMVSQLEKLPETEPADLAEFPAMSGLLSTAAYPGGRIILRSTKPIELKEAFTRIDLPQPKRLLYVSMEVSAPRDTKPRNALISFLLRGPDGAPLSAGAQITGLVWSDYPGIGYYSYIPTNPGVQQFGIKVELPEGVTCAGIALRRWRDPSIAISITKLRVEDFKEPANQTK